MARLPLHPIGAPLAARLGPDEIARHRAHMATLDAALAEKLAVTRSGWGPKYADRVREKGKLTTWERIDALRDADADVFEVGTLVNWGRKFPGSKLDAPGAGVVTAFVRIAGRWTVVIANENTVASGSWWPLTPEKIERAQTIALRLRLPIVYLVDCSGLFLPEQSRSFAGAVGAGHIFKKNALLADAGVPQIAGVFGDCIAGGGYMPIISDRVYMTESAYMVIAGAALIRGAKSQKLTSLDIGGPEVHVHMSGCADERVPDDATALSLIRREIERLPSSGAAFHRHGVEPAAPFHGADELSGLFPVDFREAYDAHDVLARLVDDSLFHEVLPEVGREMITGVARVGGLWCGFVANRQGIVSEGGAKRPGGALYREGIAKISAFSRACNDDGIPLVWLQDISGFDIGVEAERLGLLGYGSNLIYTNSTNTTPQFAILLRKASGAGYYAMNGLPYDPIVQLSTPLTRLAVMEGRTLAIATYNSKLDDDFEIATQDPAERAAIEKGMVETAARIEADMDPIAAASRMDTDEVVPVDRLRDWLVVLIEASWQSSGYRRTKNPRIWSLHDLEALTARHAGPQQEISGAGVVAGTVGEFTASVGVGAPVRPGTLVGRIRKNGRDVEVRAGDSVAGVVSAVASGWVEHGDVVVAFGEVGLPEIEAEGASVDAGGRGTVVRAETDGTVWLKASPTAPLYAPVGAQIAERGTLALVEVMKTFSAVRSPVAGEVVAVLVENGASVAAGQALFRIA